MDKNNTLLKGVNWNHLIYSSSFDKETDLANWKREGGEAMTIENGCLVLETDRVDTESTVSGNHLVAWLTKEIPANFLLEFSFKPLNKKQGLSIVFFNTRGIHGENIFEPPIKPRDGEFEQYHSGDLNNYHISYWAGTRGCTNLRKNKGFMLTASGKELIYGAAPDTFQKVQIYKNDNDIKLIIDNELALAWIDDGLEYGPVHNHSGWIGLRIMSHTWRAEYDYIKVYSVNSTAEQS